MSLAAALAPLRLLPLHVRARAEDGIALPAFAGSTLRGAFGRALKDAACVVEHRDCDACILVEACAFPSLFEPRPPPGARRLRGQDRAPAAYVLRAPPGGVVPAGDPFSFGLTLVGRGVLLLPVAAAALLRMARRGLTAERHRFSIEGVDGPGGPVLSGDPPVLARSAPVGPEWFLSPAGRVERLRVEFVEPARVIADGALSRELPFEGLVRALLRRASTLLEVHEGIELAIDFGEWIERAGEVRVERSELRRADSVRWSARQERAMNLRGVRGAVEYAGDLEPFLPLLALGVAVGIGKGTTFGLGRITLRPLPGDASVHA